MIVIPKQCFNKLNMKRLLKYNTVDILILRGNSSKSNELPDLNKILNRKLNEEVSWSFMVPNKPTIHIESVLAGNPQPFSYGKVRYDVPENWSRMTKKNNIGPIKKPKQLTDTNILFH